MAAVLIKVVVRFSSEDLLNGRVDNLLRSQVDPSAGRWTCSKEDASQRLEAEFQLERPSYIDHIDIGNYGSAFIEVFVGNSMWAPGKEFLSLLPSAMLMMPGDCKQWRKTTSVRMFHQESLNKRALKEKWDCVRVICRQPFRKDKQFGLSFIRFGTKDGEVTSPKACIKDSCPSIINGSSPKTPKGKTLLSPRLIMKSPRRNTSEGPESPRVLSRGSKMLQAALETKTKRPLKLITWPVDDSSCDIDIGDDDNEFGNHNTSVSNTKRTVYKRPTSEEKEIFERKKGRVLESEFDDNLSVNEYIEDEVKCFLDGIDFTKIDLNTVTYSDLRCEMEVRRRRKLSKCEKKTFLKLARDAVAHAVDDPCEPEAAQGSGSSTRCPKQDKEDKSQEITVSETHHSKRRTPVCSIDDNFFTDASPSQQTEVHNMEFLPRFPPSTNSPNNNNNTADTAKEQFTECPICGELFSSLAVEEHAARCMNFPSCPSIDSRCDTDNSNPLVECPICSRRFTSESIGEHANYCAETAGGAQTSGEEIIDL